MKNTHKTPTTHRASLNFRTKSLVFQHILRLTTTVEGQRLHLQYHGQCMEEFFHSW